MSFRIAMDSAGEFTKEMTDPDVYVIVPLTLSIGGVDYTDDGTIPQKLLVEKIAEYADVLKRQSEKLKRLLEDLIEASKASTGNLDVHLTPCDAAVLVTQAEGEYQEKLDAAGLTLIARKPEDPLYILADGRRLWRVFDNLMNNVCKYSQPGTRVYLTLEKQGSDAVFTFRNTSREELNVTPEELMERFVRGDSSRSTEGSGLGLSIARSFTELQNGKMELDIDGDLFKVILRFAAL